jgi:hypothetical protein
MADKQLDLWQLDLDGRIFAAMVGGFSALFLAQTKMAGGGKHSIPAFVGGAAVGTFALPVAFPKAYYGASSAGIEDDDEDDDVGRVRRLRMRRRAARAAAAQLPTQFPPQYA